MVITFLQEEIEQGQVDEGVEREFIPPLWSFPALYPHSKPHEFFFSHCPRCLRTVLWYHLGEGGCVLMLQAVLHSDLTSWFVKGLRHC